MRIVLVMAEMTGAGLGAAVAGTRGAIPSGAFEKKKAAKGRHFPFPKTADSDCSLFIAGRRAVLHFGCHDARRGTAAFVSALLGNYRVGYRGQ